MTPPLDFIDEIIVQPGQSITLNPATIGRGYCVGVFVKGTEGFHAFDYTKCWEASGSRIVRAPPAVND